jgi:hypothetical protein
MPFGLTSPFSCIFTAEGRGLHNNFYFPTRRKLSVVSDVSEEDLFFRPYFSVPGRELNSSLFFRIARTNEQKSIPNIYVKKTINIPELGLWQMICRSTKKKTDKIIVNI